MCHNIKRHFFAKFSKVFQIAGLELCPLWDVAYPNGSARINLLAVIFALAFHRKSHRQQCKLWHESTAPAFAAIPLQEPRDQEILLTKNPVKRLPILSIQNILEYDSLAMLKPYIYPNHPRIQKTFYLFLLDPREICIDARKITIWWQAFVDKQLVPNASRTAIAGTTAPALSTTATPTFATTAIPALTSDRDDASAGEKQRGICKRHRKST